MDVREAQRASDLAEQLLELAEEAREQYDATRNPDDAAAMIDYMATAERVLRRAEFETLAAELRPTPVRKRRDARRSWLNLARVRTKD